jgi:hypothetical protein
MSFLLEMIYSGLSQVLDSFGDVNRPGIASFAGLLPSRNRNRGHKVCITTGWPFRVKICGSLELAIRMENCRLRLRLEEFGCGGGGLLIEGLRLQIDVLSQPVHQKRKDGQPAVGLIVCRD